MDLQGDLRRGGVGGEVGTSEAAGEDDDAALLEVPHRPQRYVRLCDLGHLDGRLDPGGLPGGFQGVLQRERVDHGGQHPHVVGAGPVHRGSLAAPPDVPAAHHHCHLYAELL